MQSGSVAGPVAQEPESDFYPNLAHSQRGSAPLDTSYQSAYSNHLQSSQQVTFPPFILAYGTVHAVLLMGFFT